MKSGLGGRVVERIVRRGTPALAPLMAALLIAGCVSPPEGIEIVEGRELDDVPVKSGLEFVKSETYVPPLAEGTRFRSWKGVYRGEGLFQEIGPWYVGAMKSHGWTFTGIVESKGTYTYRFLKRDEEALVRVYRKYSLGTGSSVNLVEAEVHPRRTESFLPDDFEQMKATGVAWTEPPVNESEAAELRAISFTEETARPPEETASSDFLLEEPVEDSTSEVEAVDETVEPEESESP